MSSIHCVGSVNKIFKIIKYYCSNIWVNVACYIENYSDNPKMLRNFAENAAFSAKLYCRNKLAKDMASIIEKIVT